MSNEQRSHRRSPASAWGARAVSTVVVLGLYAGVVPSVFAQSGIAGVVKDTSGAVLPGVTVEASSPALIERSRSAVTDGEGLYKIVDIRPGTYAVTFTLPGFTTVKREGIDTPAAFTATVNAELRVGTVEETITVAGQAPTVDVQNVAQRTLLNKTLLDAVPTARTPQSFVPYLPGVTGGLGEQADRPIDRGDGDSWRPHRRVDRRRRRHAGTGTSKAPAARRPPTTSTRRSSRKSSSSSAPRRPRTAVRRDLHQRHPQGGRQPLLGFLFLSYGEREHAG